MVLLTFTVSVAQQSSNTRVTNSVSEKLCNKKKYQIGVIDDITDFEYTLNVISKYYLSL